MIFNETFYNSTLSWRTTYFFQGTFNQHKAYWCLCYSPVMLIVLSFTQLCSSLTVTHVCFRIETFPRPVMFGKTFWSITPLICWLSSLLMMPTSTWEPKFRWGTLWPGCCPTGNHRCLCQGIEDGIHYKKHSWALEVKTCWLEFIGYMLWEWRGSSKYFCIRL